MKNKLIPEGISAPKKEPAAAENYTYMLRCSDGSFYIGWTNNLKLRVKTHNAGRGGKYTRTRCPVELVYYEIFPTKQEAMSREWHLKQLSHAQKEALLREEINQM